MRDDELGRAYSSGEKIFEEGDIGDCMYVVQSGTVNITKKIASGDVVIATLESGEILGEMALFDRMPRSATAVAAGETRILSIDKKKLFQTIGRDPTLVLKIIKSMSGRIRRLDDEFTELRKNKLDLQIFADVNETCRFVIEESKHFIRSDNGSIMLAGDTGGTLYVVAAFGKEWNPKSNLVAGEGIAGDILRSGKSELINDVSIDPRYKSGAAKIESLLCVPLKGRSGNLGVINMSRSSKPPFTLEELKLLRSVAAYASIAIENALNFSKLNSVADDILSHASMLDLWH